MSVSFGKKGGSKTGFGSAPPPALERGPVRPIKKPRALREAMFRSGTLVFESGARMQVAIKDISATGARIEFLVRQELPAEVTLIEPMLKLRTKARVAWQNENVAGLEFISA